MRVRKKHNQGKCEFCGKEMWKPFLPESKQYRFCSIACRAEVINKGKRSPNWRGGRKVDFHGYVNIYLPGHANSGVMGYVKEHRLIMSRLVNRPLLVSEAVHHKDRDRANNSVDNLVLMTRGDHTSMHSRERCKANPSPKDKNQGAF